MNHIWVVETRSAGRWLPIEFEFIKAEAAETMDFWRGFGPKEDWRIRKYIPVDKPVKGMK